MTLKLAVDRPIQLNIKNFQLTQLTGLLFLIYLKKIGT